MGFIEKAGATLAITAGLSAGGSQLPEVFDCTDANGDNATEWIGGDIEVPHCDSENMSGTGNTLHDIGKLVAIVSITGGTACAVAVTLENRRRIQPSGS